MEIKKSTLYFCMILLVLVIGGFFFLKGDSVLAVNTASNAQVIQGQIQQVVLSQDGYNYKDTIAESGKPISISADDSVTGCLRSVVFNFNSKRYSKYLRTPEDTLELPALAEGTYNFACSMGMGYGKLIVE